MALKEHKGKFRVQVSMTRQEYEIVRKVAFEREMTVNELLRVAALEFSEDYEKNKHE